MRTRLLCHCRNELMRMETYYCDICGGVKSTEDFVGQMVIITHCRSQNPMGKITKGNQHTTNRYTVEDACHDCQKYIAQSVADAIISLKPKHE